jgi:hypothetical protein
MMKPMALDSFSDHLDRLGADLDQWPDSARQAAESLLGDTSASVQSHQAASRLLEQARLLEQRFDALPSRPASPELRRRILTERRTDFWRTVSEWFRAALWRPVAAAAMPLVLGFAIGLFQQPIDIWLDAEDDEQVLADELSMMAFTDSFEGLPGED